MLSSTLKFSDDEFNFVDHLNDENNSQASVGGELFSSGEFNFADELNNDC